MDGTIWTTEKIREEIRRLDRITGLNGAALPILFHKRGRSVGRFSYSLIEKNRGMTFSFHTGYFNDLKMPPEMLVDVIHHEYAHYMDYMDRGTSSHGKNWKQCCRVVGALPSRYFDMRRVERLQELRTQTDKRNELFDSLSAGMRINHPRFGVGAISCIRGEGLKRIADVEFLSGARKSLDLGWVCDHCLAGSSPASFDVFSRRN